MKKILKNSVMVEMFHRLQPLLSRRDKLGYVAARNCRILSNSLVEYETIRRSLVEKYGEETEDENGEISVTIKIGTPNFKSFCDEMKQFNEMEHEVDLMTAKYDDAIGILSGEEILSVDWMFED